jgi:putative flippase GtrA
VGAVPPIDSFGVEDVIHDGVPVINWLRARVRLFLGTNSVLNGVYALTYRFREPVMMALPSEPAHCAGLQKLKGMTALSALAGIAIDTVWKFVVSSRVVWRPR